MRHSNCDLVLRMQLGREKVSSYAKMLTKTSVDYLESLSHDFWKETLLLSFLRECHRIPLYIQVKEDTSMANISKT